MNKAIRIVLRCCIVLLSCGLITGCATTLTTKGPTVGNEIESGVKYYLPADVVTIKSTSTTIKTVTLNECLKPVTDSETVFELSPITIETVADTSHHYSIKLEPGWFSDDTLTINRLPNMPLLKDISLVSDGKADDAAVSMVKTIASVAGAVTGVSAFNIGDTLSQVSAARKSNISMGLAVRSEFGSKANVCDGVIEGLSRIQSYAVNHSKETKEIWESIKTDKAQLQKLEKLRQGLVDQLAVEKSDATLKQLEGKIKIIGEEYLKVQARLDVNKQQFKSQVEAASQAAKIGTQSKSQEFIRMFSVNQLPTKKDFTGCFTDDKSCKDQAVRDIVKSFREIGAAMTLDLVYDTSSTAVPFKAGKSESPVKNAIYSRDKLPYEISIYRFDNGAPILIQTKIEHLFNADTAPTGMPYETAAVGSNKLDLTFSNNGVLLTAKVTNTAKANLVAAAAEKSVTGAMTSFKQGVTSVKEIQQERYSIAKDQVQYKLDMAQKKKELVEASMAYEGTLASADKLKEKAALDAEILLLQSQKTHIETGNQAAIAEALSDINKESAVLNAQIGLDILKQAGKSASTLNDVRDNAAMLESQTEMLKALQLLIKEIEAIKTQGSVKP